MYHCHHCKCRITVDRVAEINIVAAMEGPNKHQIIFNYQSYIELFITPRASFTVIVAVILWISDPSDTILRCGQSFLWSVIDSLEP